MVNKTNIFHNFLLFIEIGMIIVSIYLSSIIAMMGFIVAMSINIGGRLHDNSTRTS